MNINDCPINYATIGDFSPPFHFMPPLQPISPRDHTDFHSTEDAQRDPNTFFVRTLVTRLHSAEHLSEPDDRVASFGQSELLTDADARAAVEGDVGPTGTELWIGPSLRTEFVGVRSVDVLSAVQGVGRKGQPGRVRRRCSLWGRGNCR